jgi:hypothetical protein
VAACNDPELRTIGRVREMRFTATAGCSPRCAMRPPAARHKLCCRNEPSRVVIAAYAEMRTCLLREILDASEFLGIVTVVSKLTSVFP